MKIKVFILMLLISAAACKPANSAAGVPTFFLVLPTATETAKVEPTAVWVTAAPLVRPVAPTATLDVKWPVATLGIVSSLPMTGEYAGVTDSIVKAEQLRLQQASNRACGGKYQLSFKALDNSTEFSTGSDPQVETANAQSAADRASVVAYLGAFTSDDARLIIPILNRAGPLVIISPSSTYPGLTKPVTGVPDEPDKYYPTGIRNFARVITTDDIQAAVSATFMAQELGVKSVFILDDEQPYGKLVSDVFDYHARVEGIRVVGHEAIDPVTRSYRALLLQIGTSTDGFPPDAIFASTPTSEHAILFLKDEYATLGGILNIKLMGPARLHTQSLIDGAGPEAAEGVYAAVPGLRYPDGLGASGQQFIKDYKAAYGEPAQPAAIYGYEAMNVLLKAIDDVCTSGGDPTDRRQVRDAVFAVHDFSGVLGTWGFDQNGDTTLTGSTIYQVKDGAWQVVKIYK